MFSQIGAFDKALQTAQSLGVDRTNVFEHLAIRCVHLSQQQQQEQVPSSNTQLFSNVGGGIVRGRGRDDFLGQEWLLLDENVQQWEGSLASRAWTSLDLYLNRYDDSTGQGRRHVLCVILQEDRRTRLSGFLLDWFMAHDPDYLIWRLVEYDLLEDAFTHALQMVEQVCCMFLIDSSFR